MISRLQKVDPRLGNSIHKAVFLGDPARPASRQNELQWFRLADAVEWVFHHRFHEFQDSKSCLTISFDPELQILSKLGMEDGLPVSLLRQAPSPGEAFRLTLACPASWRRELTQ